MGCRPEMRIGIDYEYDRFTHSLPRTVLTVSKRDVLTFEARPWNNENVGGIDRDVAQPTENLC
jgi:hypothetical protein